MKTLSLRAALVCAALLTSLSAQVVTPSGPATGSPVTVLLQSTASMPALQAACASYNLEYLNYQTGERRVCVAGLIQPEAVASQIVGTAIASATTIAPVSKITHITGTTDVVNITAPAAFATAGTGGCLTFIPDGIFHTTNAGNIALATTAVVSKALTECYDATAVKWYPSY